jgi:hypothetical protein
MSRLKSPFFWFILAVLTTAGLTSVGPQDKALGDQARIIYLHGAWLLTAETVLGLAALVGLVAILTRREALHRWSAALGRTGVFFWAAYLPMALWAFQTSWAEFFQTEPRFQATVALAAAGVALQITLSLLAKPRITSLINVLFYVALQISVSRKGYILHSPPPPIFGSGILSIELFFIGIIFLTMASAYFMTRWWLSR